MERGMLTKKKKIIPLLLAFFVLESLGSPYITWAVLMAAMLIDLYLHGMRIRIGMLGFEKMLGTIMLIGVASGLIAFSAGKVSTWFLTRDVIRVSCVPLYWYFGRKFSKENAQNDGSLFRTVFLFAFLNSIFQLGYTVANISEVSNLYDLASQRIMAEGTLAIGAFLCFFKPSDIGKHYFGPALDRLFSAVILLTFASSFSRTTYVIFACLVLFCGVKNVKALLKIVIVVAAGAAVLFFAFPDITQEFLEKILNSVAEMFVSNREWQSSDIVDNWRSYEVYCAQIELSKYSVFEKLFGKGFGKTVDALGYAYLVTTDDSLPYLHNGYYTFLIKTGLVGLLCVICYWISLIKLSGKIGNSYRKRFSYGLVISMAISMMVTMGIFWNCADMVMVIMLGWLVTEGLADFRKKKKTASGYKR